MLSNAQHRRGQNPPRDGDRGTLDGDQVTGPPGCCSPVSQLLRAGISGRSGSGRSLNSLSIEPRRCWGISEPGGSSSLCNSGVGREGQGSFCPPLRGFPAWEGLAQPCSTPLLSPPRAQRGCRTPGRRGEDLTRRVGAELQLAAPLGAAGRAAGAALAGRLQGAEMPTVGLTASSPAKPHQAPQKHPGVPHHHSTTTLRRWAHPSPPAKRLEVLTAFRLPTTHRGQMLR